MRTAFLIPGRLVLVAAALLRCWLGLIFVSRLMLPPGTGPLPGGAAREQPGASRAGI